MARYKKRADGRYETKINLGVKPDGTYIRKGIYGHTIAELEENIREARNQHEQGVDLTVKKPLVKDWAERWLAVYKPDIKRSMREVYAGMIHKWLEPIHAVKIDHVRQIQLQEILQTASKQLSQSSVDKLYNCIRGVFSSARQNGLLAVDISERLTKPTGGAKTRRESLSGEEQEIMAEICRTEPNGLLPMIILLSGLRIGEVLALTYGDMRDGFITVRKTIVYEENGNKPTVKPSPKTDAGFRRIPILPTLEPFIAAHKGTARHLDTEYVFSSNGRLFSKIMRRRLWERLMTAYRAEWDRRHAMENNGMICEAPPAAREITSHMLRHTFITMLYDAGIDIKTAQKWAGHATVSVLMDIYTHLSDGKEKAAIDKLTAFASGQKPDDNFDDTDDNLTTQRTVQNQLKPQR